MPESSSSRMTAYDEPELDIEQLKLEIRQAAGKRGHGSSRRPLAARASRPSRSNSTAAPEINLPELRLSPDFQIRKDNHYHVNDLLKYHDGEFVRNAYRAILKRGPDEAGYRDYVEALRSGHINKMDVLARLSWSDEGGQANVRIDGLKLPATVRVIGRIPVIGYLFQLLIGILRLPSSTTDRRHFESYSIVQQQAVADHINRLAAVVRSLSKLTNELPEQMDEQQRRTKLLIQEQVDLLGQQQHQTALLDQQQHQTALLDQQQQQLRDLLGQQTRELASLLEQHQQKLMSQDQAILGHDNSLKVQQNALAELSREAATQKEEVATHKDFSQGLNHQLLDHQKNLRAQSEAAERLSVVLQQMRTDLTMQQARVASLINAVDKNLKPLSPKRAAVFREEDDHLMDALYVSLEDQFRGDKSEVKSKFKFYLPYLKRAGITKDILDIGCGRGEWLELLKENGLKAKGIDVNRAMAEQCREAGFDVSCVDAIDYLRALPDNSVSAITSFHVIEHLDFKVLVEFIDQIVRTLRHDGLLIFETPNPENVLVASCNFYLDPSHRRPLPSQVMRFLLEAKGLTDLEVVNLHPLQSARIAGDTELTDRFNDIFYGPMDYAIVGRKSNPSPE